MRSSANVVVWCAFVVVLFLVRPIHAEHLFLVVAASANTPGAIAERAKVLTPESKTGLVIQTGDCGEKRNVFAFVTEVAASRTAAQRALEATKAVIPDSYIKSCDARPGSLLMLRVPAVDLSIADVPKDAVNWSDQDRVSVAEPLPDGRTRIIVRYYEKLADDPLEGRRERVLVAQSAERKIVLEQECANPGKTVMANGRIAFDCVKEQAGDHLLHSVVVFDSVGKKLKEVSRCRGPKWVTSDSLACEAESVDASGELALEPTRIELK